MQYICLYYYLHTRRSHWSNDVTFTDNIIRKRTKMELISACCMFHFERIFFNELCKCSDVYLLQHAWRVAVKSSRNFFENSNVRQDVLFKKSKNN